MTAFDKIASGLKGAIEFAKDVSAKRRHERELEWDTATFGLNGYWKRKPHWPREGNRD